METVPARFTRKDYALLPEGFPAQLIRGCLVKEASPNYRHAYVSTWFVERLLPLVPRGCVLHAPTDVGLDDYNVYQPDVVVLREPPASMDVHDVGVPLLAIEVLSPSTERRDRHVKCPRLLKAGVAEVWLVDPIAETIEIHVPSGAPRVARGHETLTSHAVPGFDVVPAIVFEPPAGTRRRDSSPPPADVPDST
jgi:Uma2 family endonuclease